MATPSERPTLALIDASNYLYRAFYAIRGLTGPGRQADERGLRLPEHVAQVRGGPQARRASPSASTGTRRRSARRWTRRTRRSAQAMPDDLVPQIEDAKRLCRLLGLAVLEEAGFEADDLIGSIAAVANAGRLPRGDLLGRQGPLPAREGPRRRRVAPREGRRARREGGSGLLRRQAVAGPRRSRAHGRLVRQHPRHPGHRREDGQGARRDVRLPRRDLRAPRGGEGQAEGPPRRRPRRGVPLADARDRPVRPAPPGGPGRSPRALPDPPARGEGRAGPRGLLRRDGLLEGEEGAPRFRIGDDGRRDRGRRRDGDRVRRARDSLSIRRIFLFLFESPSGERALDRGRLRPRRARRGGRQGGPRRDSRGVRAGLSLAGAAARGGPGFAGRRIRRVRSRRGGHAGARRALRARPARGP